MLAVAEAKKLIVSGNFSEIDVVKANFLPKNIISNTDKTIVLVTDVRTDPTTAGNNDFYGLRRQIEVQIFYKLKIDFDLEAFETRLMKLFTKNHWSVVDIREHSTDPDTEQMTAVFYFENEKILN